MSWLDDLLSGNGFGMLNQQSGSPDSYAYGGYQNPGQAPTAASPAGGGLLGALTNGMAGGPLAGTNMGAGLQNFNSSNGGLIGKLMSGANGVATGQVAPQPPPQQQSAPASQDKAVPQQQLPGPPQLQNLLTPRPIYQIPQMARAPFSFGGGNY